MWWVVLYVLMVCAIIWVWQKLLGNVSTRRSTVLLRYTACFVGIVAEALAFGGLWWVALYVLMAYVIVRWWQKFLADQGARRRAVLLQYAACFGAAIAGALAFGEVTLNESFAIILGIGFMNGFAAYCQWQAIAISLSKNSLFTFLDDCIALLLAYVVLGETKFLNPMLVAGTVFSVGVVVLYARHAYAKKKADEARASLSSKFFFYVAVYSIIWGVATFLIRYFAVQKIGAFQFLVPWYAGALIAASFLYLSRDRNETMPDGSAIPPLMVKGLAARLVFGVLIALCLAIEYKAFECTPQAVVQPILLVAELLVPTAIGLYWFREREKLDPGEWKYLAFGILGGLLTALGYIIG